MSPGMNISELWSAPSTPDPNSRVAQTARHAEELRRPLTLTGLAGGLGATVEELLDGLTPEERDALDRVFRHGRVRAALDTLRSSNGSAPSAELVRDRLRDIARSEVVTQFLTTQAKAAADAAHTCTCCHQVEPSTRWRDLTADRSGVVCALCATAIAHAEAERVAKDKRRMGQALVWINAQA